MGRLALASGAVVTIGLLVGGCGESGRLLISLQRPTDPILDPMQDTRLSKFSLRIIQDGLLKDQETFRTAQNELAVGSVPVGKPFDLRLAGKSASGQMLGLGLVFDVEVPPEGETAIAVKFRKPIGYVGGASGLEVLDVTASTRESVTLDPLQSQIGVVDVAASPDGGWLLVLTASTLEAYRTSDQQKWAETRLPAIGNCLAVSPDNHFAVVCHSDQQELSVVDLIGLAEGEAQIRPVMLAGKPTKVVFGQQRNRAQVLVNGVGHKDGCDTMSGVFEVDLDTASVVHQLAMGKPTADVVVDPRDGSLIVALPCENALGRVEQGQAKVLPVQVPKPYDLAVTDQDLVVMGSIGGDSPKGRAVSFDLSRPGFTPQTKSFSLPSLSVWFSGHDASGSLGILLALDAFTIYDVMLSPDGQRALGLYQAHYTSNLDFGSCSFLTDLGTTGYILVDLTAESQLFSRITSMVFAQCSTCDTPEKTSCVNWFKQGLYQANLLSNPEFEPRGVALLFGGT